MSISKEAIERLKLTVQAICEAKLQSSLSRDTHLLPGALTVLHDMGD